MQCNIAIIRYLFDNKIKFHPKWNENKYKALQELFNLDPEEIEQLYLFSQDICNHRLEQSKNDL